MKFPKILAFLAIVFVQLFALPTKAETSFAIETAWIVKNNEFLVNNFTGNVNLKFPEEFSANVSWLGATVTDGNIIGTVIALHNPQSNFNTLSGHQGFMFRVNLRANAIVAAAFPNGFQMRPFNDWDYNRKWLILYSPELSKANLDALRLMELWNDLGTRTDLGFIQFFPERILLPTLPPEQEDESEFIKKVRKRFIDNYRDGQFVGTKHSFLLGVQSDGREFKFICEWQNVEDTLRIDSVESSFLFGGFVDPDAPFSVAFRVPFGKESFKDWLSIPFRGRIGIRVTPPKERKDDKKYNISASATVVLPSWFSTSIASHCSEEDGYHLTRDGNLVMFYPKQPEDRPAEDGVLSNEELDKMNEEMARSILAFLVNVRDSLLSMDWSHPLDFAVTSEDEVGYLALAYPPAETYIDWSLAVQLIHTVADSMQQARPDNPLDLDALFEFEIQEIPGTIAGLPGYRLRLRLSDEQRLAIVFTHEPGIIYAAVLSLTDGDVVTEEQFAAIQRRLEQKIEASRKSVAKGIAPPTTVLRANIDDTRFRADFETTVRGYRFTVYIAQESFGNVLALSQQFGVNPLQWLPFWQTQ